MVELKTGDRVKVYMGLKPNGQSTYLVGSVLETQIGFGIARVFVTCDNGLTGWFDDGIVFRLLDWPLEVSKYDVLAALLGNRAPAANADAFETAMLHVLARQERREREEVAAERVGEPSA